MARRLFGFGLSVTNKNVSLPTLVVSRAMSSKKLSYEWNIFAFGAGRKPVPESQKQLAALGYKNVKSMGIYNTKESDQEIIAGLKERQWDAVAIGGYVNGFDQDAKYHEKDISTDRAEILMWFNRVLNLVHELAPKAKIVLLKSPQDAHDAIQRVMGTQQKQTKA